MQKLKLITKYPDLKCIIAPTTVGIAAAGKVITDKGLIGEVMVTGLGLPSEMAEYIETAHAMDVSMDHWMLVIYPVTLQ